MADEDRRRGHPSAQDLLVELFASFLVDVDLDKTRERLGRTDFVAKAGFDPVNGRLAAFLTADPCRLLVVERRRQRFELGRFTFTLRTPAAYRAVDARQALRGAASSARWPQA